MSAPSIPAFPRLYLVPCTTPVRHHRPFSPRPSLRVRGHPSVPRSSCSPLHTTFPRPRSSWMCFARARAYPLLTASPSAACTRSPASAPVSSFLLWPDLSLTSLSLFSPQERLGARCRISRRRSLQTPPPPGTDPAGPDPLGSGRGPSRLALHRRLLSPESQPPPPPCLCSGRAERSRPPALTDASLRVGLPPQCLRPSAPGPAAASAPGPAEASRPARPLHRPAHEAW